MAKRQQFTKAFKLEAVRLWKSSGRPAATVARELGLRRNHLYKWQLELETSKLLLIQAPDRAPKQLDQALSHLHRVIQETRDFIPRLEPRTASHDSLLQSLQLLVQRRDSWPCPPFLIDVDPVAAGRLSVEQEIHLLAFAREAVSNVVHHAQASSGTIRFGLWEGTARLEIQDDGIGFSPAEIGTNSPGLMNITTHVKKLQGRLTIESAPSEGTTILVAIPQPQEAQLMATPDVPILGPLIQFSLIACIPTTIC